MSQYKSEVPSNGTVKKEIADFFEAFYTISDTPDAHELYRDQFTKDATLIMATDARKGSEEILAKRKSMWEKVAERSHKPIKIFPFSSNGDEVMLHGDVDYVLKDGKKAHVDWSARAHFVQEDGQLKMDFYQVYLVSGWNNSKPGDCVVEVTPTNGLQDTAAMAAAK